jgi:hypothetical protein
VTFTRTHTHYWGEEQIEPLRTAYDAIAEDFDKRRPYITDEAEAAGDMRLDALRSAIALAAEPVPPEFGG